MRTNIDNELVPFLQRIERHLETVSLPTSAPPRLEPWEVNAFTKSDCASTLDDMYCIAAALRLKIEEEVGDLARARESGVVDAHLARRIEWTLTRARSVDALFDDLMNKGPFPPHSAEIEQLNRSRLRLIRVFSGLWLLHDQMTRRGPGA
ncbi:MAG TPA: hypothetical protein VMS98_01440 [Thermoanaerobaculia bacterium]|nr:hypothetical protein [Thermoanaerobaculia bacterium]